MVLSALVLKLLATHINHDGPQSYGSAVCMLDGMGTQIILGCPGGGLGPGLKAMSAPRRRRFGLSVNLSRNP